MSVTKITKADYYVADVDFKLGKAMVEQYHYSKGGSNTYVYMHGLYRKSDNQLCGVAWWLPPTRVAAESVNKENWMKVLSLTRLVVLPGVPSNACSFLLSRSRKLIAAGRRFCSLVSYADDYMGHLGQIYKADNWEYVGRTGPYVKWHNSEGKQVAAKATVNRTKAEMLELGHTRVGSFYKHKYVYHLKFPPVKGVKVMLDIDRLTEALSQPSLSIPMGLSSEEKRKAMLRLCEEA